MCSVSRIWPGSSSRKASSISLRRQLGDILTYVEQIRALDTTGVAPTSQGMNRPVDRDDVPADTLTRAQLLDNAPDAAVEAGLFKVPRVIG